MSTHIVNQAASYIRFFKVSTIAALLTIPQVQANMIVLKDGESFSQFSTMEYCLMIAAGLTAVIIICTAIYLYKNKKSTAQPYNPGQVTMPIEPVTHPIGSQVGGGTIGLDEPATPPIGSQVGGGTIGLDEPVTPPVIGSGPCLTLTGNLNTGEVVSASIYYSELIEPSEKSVAVGRDSTLWLYIKDSSVSRMHAELKARDGKFWVRDKHSGNGTRVSGTALPQKRFVPLSDGDTIAFGKIETRVAIR